MLDDKNRKSQIANLKLLNRVFSAFAKGLATQDAFETHPGSADRSVFFDRLHRVC